MAHIFATVSMGNILARYSPAPKPYIRHTSCPHFFSPSVGHIISIMWEDPYSAEAPEPHMAHILTIRCPKFFLRGGGYVKIMINIASQYADGTKIIFFQFTKKT